MASAITRGGLSLGDFDALTLPEWAAVAEAICHSEESRERLNWERARLLYYASIAPHIQGRQTAADLLPFPWDSDQKKEPVKAPTKKDIERIYARFGED